MSHTNARLGTQVNSSSNKPTRDWGVYFKGVPVRSFTCYASQAIRMNNKQITLRKQPGVFLPPSPPPSPPPHLTIYQKPTQDVRPVGSGSKRVSSRSVWCALYLSGASPLWLGLRIVRSPPDHVHHLKRSLHGAVFLPIQRCPPRVVDKREETRRPERERGGRGTQFVHGSNCMTIDLRIPTMPGRSTSGFHQPGRHCLHQARSAVRCSASRMKGELHPSKNRS